MRKERKMVNFSKETATKLSQLKLAFSIVLDREITNSALIDLLNKNKAAVIGALKLMNRL